MSTTENRSDLDAVEADDTIAIDVDAVAKGTETATVNQTAVPGKVSPLGAFDGNVSPLGAFDGNVPPTA